MSKDASFVTERNRRRMLFAARVLKETALQNNLTNTLNLEGPGNHSMTYSPHYYLMKEGAYFTTPEEYAEYVASVGGGSTPGPVATVPDAPIDLSATGGDEEVTISFTPGSDGGSSILNYEYYLLDASGAAWTAFDPPVTTSPIIISGLPNGSPLEFKIRAVNAVGAGAESDVVTGTPEAPPTDVPLAPVLTAITFKTIDSITLTFTQESNGTPAITNYKYSLNGGAYTAFSPIDRISPVTISGLSSNTSYTIRLKAINTNGDSSASNDLTETTFANVNYETFTTPGTTSWTAPEGVTFVQYVVVGGGGGGGAAYSKINVLGNILVTDTPQAGAYWINSANLTNGRYSGRMYFGNNSGQNSSSFTDPIRLTASQNFTPSGVTYDYNKWYNTEIVYSLTSSLVTTTNWIPPYIISSVYTNNVSGGGGGGAGGQVRNISGTTKYTVTSGTSYTVVVGNGGAGGVGGVNSETVGSAGENSSFDTITATGGSGGGHSRLASYSTNGNGNGGFGGQSSGYLVGGNGGGQTSMNNYGRYNSGGPGVSGTPINFDGSGFVFYGPGGDGGVPNTVASDTTLANRGKGGKGTGATLNSYANGIDGGSGIVILKYYT